MVKSFKIKNPYRSDQEVKQDVYIGEDLTLDYSNSPWIALDTEYLSFNPLQDKLCVIQIASRENSGSESTRVEIIWVFCKEKASKLSQLLVEPKIEKLFHVYSSDVPRLERYLGERLRGKIFDTKVAAKIAWTNTTDYSMKHLVRMFCDPNFEQMDNEKGLNDWDIGPENWSNQQIYYMVQDVIYLDALREKLIEMAKRRGTFELLNEVMDTLPAISQLYKKGYNENVLSY